MRTTVNIEEDLLDMARASARKLKKPFRAILNEALRAGLEQIGDVPARRPYKTIPHDMGLQKGRSLDNVQELLSQLDGDDAR
jgi:mRNA-degrading endonuclease RelE of RelBE toxin-antitoxin system